MKKWIIAAAVLVVLVSAGGTGWFLLRGGDDVPPDDMAVGAEEAMPVPVEHGSITDELVLDAKVEEEPEKKVVSKRGGTVTRVWVSDGQEVQEGAPIVSVRSEDAGTAPEPGEGSGDGAGGEGAGPQQPAATEVTVNAPVSGKVGGLKELAAGDPVEPGAAVASISREQFRAVAQVPANDLYRFYDDPEEITLKIDKGPPAQACRFLSIGEGEGSGGGGGGSAPEEEAGMEGEGGEGATSRISCRVPEDLQVFPGVTGKMSIVTGSADNALLVPVTAVRGGFEKGEVIVVGDGGGQETREVELGITDGESIQVVKGLEEGDQVLDPIPLEEGFDVPDSGGEEDEFADEEMVF
ncbi:HlyD family efflux transporter periplasmic adaptor subunit [Nocardiopsis composta]|uniref:Multidrug efflux pump subunit AcrA (Membrane-fusion protein) n=1 Tax=Nocardiopsis composta TaxID=157465 RepID=A0A7W8QQP7_9ACTN|nr:HlyD family efflux transporter periplasmic adaptor subunit [Nocardiopsis composta]MBB5434833.1 multidrug efflux pump subunit AcrA (membrane-fusion protein) [Nocardiopsis composta]